MKKIILIILYCGLCLHQYAQKNKIDSLLILLQSAKDTAKVTVMNELSKSLWYYQLEQANDYNLKALHLADSISFQKGLAEANRCRGVILSFKKDPAAMSYLETALKIFRKLNNKRGIAATLNNQSGLYNNNNESSRALDVATQSLKLFEELNDPEAIGAVINQIGFIYEQQSDFTAALAHYLKA